MFSVKLNNLKITIHVMWLLWRTTQFPQSICGGYKVSNATSGWKNQESEISMQNYWSIGLNSVKTCINSMIWLITKPAASEWLLWFINDFIFIWNIIMVVLWLYLTSNLSFISLPIFLSFSLVFSLSEPFFI